MKVGYARTSSVEQLAGLEAQLRDLDAAGCEKVFSEQVSSVGKRERLDAALDFIREGDVLTVTRVDRLARSTQHLLQIVDLLNTKGAHLHVLNMNLNTSDATGKLMLTVIGAVGAWEREMMLERQREGIRKAVEAKRYKGRKPTARAKASEIDMLRQEGVGPTEIAKRLGIGRASVYRVMKS